MKLQCYAVTVVVSDLLVFGWLKYEIDIFPYSGSWENSNGQAVMIIHTCRWNISVYSYVMNH